VDSVRKGGRDKGGISKIIQASLNWGRGSVWGATGGWRKHKGKGNAVSKIVGTQ